MKLEDIYIVDKYGAKVELRHIVMYHSYDDYMYFELDDFTTIRKLYGTQEEYYNCEREYWGED